MSHLGNVFIVHHFYAGQI